MSSNNDMSSGQQYDHNGVMQSGNLNYNGTNMQMSNPGQFMPQDINAAAGQYVTNNTNLYNQFQNSAAGSAFNPAFYDQMKNTQQAGMTTALGNQYAAMGLSGSSAQMGGMANAINQNDMSWLNRQQGDQMQALRGLEGLNQQGYQQTMGIQNQYGSFQDSYNQSLANLLGVQSQATAANNAMWGGIASSALGGAGMAIGGAGGA